MSAPRQWTAHRPRGEGARRLAAPFRILVLLEDRLTLRLHELRDALQEDFPQMDWPDDPAVPDLHFDTVDAPVGVVSCGRAAAPAAITAHRRSDIAWAELLPRNRLTPVDRLARRLAAAHTHLEIAVTSRGPTLADRLEAARRATAIAAVFADLPIAAGAIQLWSDRVLSPQQTIDLAASAAAGEVPLLDWTLPLLFDHDPTDEEAGLSSGTTVGLSALLGYELELRQSPEPPGLVIAAIMSVAQELVTGGVVFRDGGEIAPFGSDAAMHRTRLVPEGVLGNDTDRWSLVHPESAFDDQTILGRTLPESPERGFMGRAMDFLTEGRLSRLASRSAPGRI
ncbi:hypothetical protein [Jannaschia seohaensis]|uniref:Uncharacterized protein n=1 Tax=Jannaschia seohaensis TaxID=475081 RepID=A0A2Y9AE68_9RHOB|nr:hypothetical protein [Jannaschia seohaensis]PWJ21148.1 hypothetical protein BCF38_102398 [Jannaschia seohaensis]SSA41558.1 hypothetical protein SAMN05421539_102398 [Jannaschia seohaensis]